MTSELYFTIVLYVMTGLLGLCVGSFLNVVIYRVPNGMSLSKPASHCPQCKEPIRPYDNIPLLSYCLLGGKCRHCHTHIPFRYTAVEIVNAVLWLLCVYLFWEKSIACAVILAVTMSLLLCVFFIDLEHMLIFDRFQILLAVMGVAYTVADRSPLSGGDAWWSHLIGAAAGGAVFWLVGYLVGKVAKREAMGFGDVKFSIVMGLFLGWQKLLLAVLIASLAGSIILIVLKRKNGEEGKEYPFAPFLTTGFAIAALWGDVIISWYTSLLI